MQTFSLIRAIANTTLTTIGIIAFLVLIGDASTTATFDQIVAAKAIAAIVLCLCAIASVFTAPQLWAKVPRNK